MLADPLVINTFSSAAPVYTVANAATFRKISTGSSTAIDGLFSADQPCHASTKQRRRKLQGFSVMPNDHTLRLERHFNVPAVNGMVQPDAPLIAEIRILSFPQYHSVADCRMLLNAASQTEWVFLDRLQAGEGI